MTMQDTPDPRVRALATARVEAALREGLDGGHFPGAQFYASVGGQVVVDTALGEARLGVPMKPDTAVSWQCATKPVTAAAVCLLGERGSLDLDDPVVRYLPRFGQHGKGPITLRHLLSHLAGFANDPPWRSYGPLTPEQVEDMVCASRLRQGWEPGADVLYSNWHGYSALGAVVSKVDGRPFARFAREELFEPLDLKASWIGVEQSEAAAVAECMAFVYDVAGPRPEILPFGGLFQGRDLQTCSPASGGVGPVRELGRMYESFLDSLRQGRRAVLGPATVQEMVQRTTMSTGRGAFHGLGFLVLPQLFAQWCPRAFGHPGLRCVQAYADPRTGIVVSAAVNGLGRGVGLSDAVAAAGLAVYQSLVEVGLVMDPA
jgi:CubicO group peptidase (beta-lactamase class C family)